MPDQAWFCERCDKEGTVTYKKGADVYSVINLIEDSHRKTSPSCPQPRMMIRASSKKEALAKK